MLLTKYHPGTTVKLVMFHCTPTTLLINIAHYEVTCTVYSYDVLKTTDMDKSTGENQANLLALDQVINVYNITVPLTVSYSCS